MSRSASDSTRFLSMRFFRRALLSFVLLALALCFWMLLSPYQRERQVAIAAEELGAEVFWNYQGPKWLPQALRRTHLFDRITFIRFARAKVRTGVNNSQIRRLMASLRQAACLEAFDADGLPLTDDEISHIGTPPYVKLLSLASTHIADDGLEAVSGLRSLVSLDLSETRISDSGLVHLSSLHALQDLRLRNTHISGTGLSALTHLPALQYLNLAGTNITDRDLEFVSQSATCVNLDISWTQVGALESLRGTQIASLTIAGTRITDDGLAHLRQLPKLRCLTVDMSQLTENGITHLQAIPNLQELRIVPTEGDIIEAEQFNRVREALPQCEIGQRYIHLM